MKKIIYLFGILLVSDSFALDINKAVEFSLVNNNIIKENQFIIKENSEVLNSSKSLYQPKLDLKYTYDNKFQKNQGENKNDSELNVDLTYNLFNGFKDEKTINSNKNNLQMTKYNYEAIKLDIVLKTKQDFISYLKTRKNTFVQKNALKLFQRQYTDSKNFYDNGVNITLNNLLEVEISLLEAKKLLKDAISTEKVAKQRLFNTMGIMINENIDDVPLEREDYSQYLDQEGILNTLEIASLIEYKNSLKNQKEVILGNFYPKIDATIRHKRYGDSFALNERDGSYQPQNIALLEFSWNLYNGKKDQSDILAYKHKVSQINYQIAQLKQDLALQYIEAEEKLILEKQNLDISKKAFEQAEVNNKIVKNSFKEGIVTSKDLIDANYLLIKSESAYYDSYYDNLLVMAQIERILEIKEK